MKVQTQDSPDELPPGTGYSQIKSPNVCLCSLCRGSNTYKLELQDQDVKSDIFGTAEARETERRSGARGTGGRKGNVALGRGFGGDHQGCAAREMLPFWI